MKQILWICQPQLFHPLLPLLKLQTSSLFPSWEILGDQH